MGRGKFRNRGNRGGGGHKRDNKFAERSDSDRITKENPFFEKYYNDPRQSILQDDEKEIFWKHMKSELPYSFRFTGSKGHALSVQQRLIDYYIPEIKKVQYNGEYVEPPKPVEWYPEKLAWAITTGKQVIRKFPPFASFQRFLVSETSVGNISRQELVSMIPPLLMDIKPSMSVLDMCAAPGSKSAQIIEMLHKGEEYRIRKVSQQYKKKHGYPIYSNGNQVDLEQEPSSEYQGDPEDWSDDGRSIGLFVANDADSRRAHMLVHQVKRLNSPNIIVTNHDASQFPSLKIPSDPSTPKQPKYLKFDRILADVPCSGDGTARKNYSVWKQWLPMNAIGLHPMQLRILVRALQMLKKGGRCVYSTCSLNPLENEAVIASAIEMCGGSSKVRIINCDSELPALKRVKGLKSWNVMDKKGNFMSSWNDAQELLKNSSSFMEKEVYGKFTRGMFPRENWNDIEIENCMRVYPHHQDTGGFFITVLEKITEIKGPLQEPNATTKEKEIETSHTATNGNQASKAEVDEPIQPTEGVSDLDENNEEEEVFEEVTKNKRSLSDPDTPERPSKTSKTSDLDSIPDKYGASINHVSNTISATKDDPSSAPTSTLNLDLLMNSRPNNKQMQEEYFKYIPSDHSVIESVGIFYEISSRFPKDRYLVRNPTGEPSKAVYYTSTLVRDILVQNEGRGVKFIQAGIKMFVKQDAQGQDICRWRIQCEGLPILDPWIGETRVVHLTKKPVFQRLLKEMFIKLSNDAYKELGEVGERIQNMSMGCSILRIEPSNDPDGFKERLVYPIWRSLKSTNLMLPKEERKALLLRFYNDNSPLVDTLKPARRNTSDIEDNEEKEDRHDQEITLDAVTIVNVENQNSGDSHEAIDSKDIQITVDADDE